MKKLLGIVVLCLLWCNAGNAGNAGPADINEPGQDEKCAKKSIKKIFKKEVLKKVSEGRVMFFYFSCDPIGKYDEWAYNHLSWDYYPELDLQDLHDSSYGECMKNADIYTKQDCFLYSIDDVIVWGKDAAFVRKLEKEVYKKIAIKKKEIEAKEKQAMEEAKALYGDVEDNNKTPITPESIADWDTKCDKEDFKKYVATVEGCIALQHLGKIDKSKKKLVVFMHGDRKAKDDYKIKGWWTFSSVIKDEKKNINFFYLARPGHKFKGRSRSPGKYKNYEVLNKRVERVQFKKGWQSNRLISQALYRLKEFYQPDKLIVIGFSGGANDIGVISGKVPGLIDIGIMGGCDCIMTKRPFWIPGEFIKTIDPKTELILISGEKDEYVALAKHYARVAKEQGLNVKMHVVKGGHQKETLLKHGKEIVKEALK